MGLAPGDVQTVALEVIVHLWALRAEAAACKGVKEKVHSTS